MRLDSTAERNDYRNIWVVAEEHAGSDGTRAVAPVTLELLGAARTLAAARNSEVWCVVPGAVVSSSALIAQLAASGSDVVLLVDDPRLQPAHDEAVARTMAELIRKYQPEVVLGAATSSGRAIIPRIAVLTESGLTADCTALAIDPANGDLLQTRPAFGGNLMATIRSPDHRPQLATVRPRVMQALPPDPMRCARVINEPFRPHPDDKLKQITALFQGDTTSASLGTSHFIIAGGRGIGGVAGVQLLQQLATKCNAAVAASRAVVDAGWLPYPHQVGQTGQTVQAKTYLACGISGQIQHLVGMQACELIIAIDKNPDTPLMQLADIAIVGDLFAVVSGLLRLLNQAD